MQGPTFHHKLQFYVRLQKHSNEHQQSSEESSRATVVLCRRAGIHFALR